MTLRHGLLLTTAILIVLAAGCGRQEMDVPGDGRADADTFRFHGPDELRAFFGEAGYSLERWDEGDRTVPRFYLARVPSRWRTEVGPNLPPAVKKRSFFFVYAPLVLEANEAILADRNRLKSLIKKDRRTEDEDAWLRTLAARYRLNPPEDGPVPAAMLVRLQRRVDIVPPSLALAQAAVESGWSTSRFADLGNALFGQWTWGDDGITPTARREHLGDYGIKAFATPAESIAAYMRNLNTHPSYREFRSRRAELRKQGKKPSGLALAETLTSYSEEGEAYTRRLASVIRVNSLGTADEARLRDMTPVMLLPVGEGSD